MAHFFETVEIRLLEGRPIDERAVAAGAKVEVGNEDFAAKYFEGRTRWGAISTGARPARRWSSRSWVLRETPGIPR